MQQVSFLPLFSTTVQPLYSEPQGSMTFVRYIQSSLYTNSPKKCGFHTWQFILGITVGLNSVDNIPSVAKASFPFPSFMGALATAFFEGWQFCKLLSSMLIADMLFYCIHRGHPTSDKINQLNCVKQWIFSVLQIASVADIHTWQENYWGRRVEQLVSQPAQPREWQQRTAFYQRELLQRKFKPGLLIKRLAQWGLPRAGPHNASRLVRLV